MSNDYERAFDALRKRDTCQLLILIQANPRLVFEVDDKHGWTLLHSAACMGRVCAAEILMQYNAEVDSRTNNGRTPLHYAACERNDEVARLLLDAGADINVQDADGFTPLFLAIRECDDSDTIVDVLLECHADVNIANNSGQKPSDQIQVMHHRRIHALLENYESQS